MKVTNISAGPRGINTAAGPVLIEPGQTRDLDVPAAEAKIAKATGWFSFDREDGYDDAAGADEREDLKKQAAELGIDHARNISTAKLKELIDAKLAS